MQLPAEKAALACSETDMRAGDGTGKYTDRQTDR